MTDRAARWELIVFGGGSLIILALAASGIDWAMPLAIPIAAFWMVAIAIAVVVRAPRALRAARRRFQGFESTLSGSGETNWKLGLFRLWMVATIIWIAIVILERIGNWPRYVFRYGDIVDWQMITHLMTGLGLALVPPLGVLIVAGIVAWIWRGFRPNKI